MAKYWLSLLLSIGIALAFTSTAQAAVNCGVAVGNHNAGAGVIVESYWAYEDGTIGGTSDNTAVRMSENPLEPGNGNISYIAPGAGHPVPSRQGEPWRSALWPGGVHSADFQQYDTGCGDGHNMLLGDQSQGNKIRSSDVVGAPEPFTPIGESWNVNCWSNSLQTYATWDITGVGTPSGIPAGRTGHWNVVHTSFLDGNPTTIKNSFNTTIVIVYTLNPPNPPRGQNSPIAAVDPPVCDGNVSGWAFDPDQQSRGIQVMVFVDQPFGSSGATPFGTFTANQNRPGLNAQIQAAYGYSPGDNHGFSFAVPASLQDGKDHTFYIYAVDNNGQSPNTAITPAVMTGCGQFTLTPSSSGAQLLPPGDNPSSFTFNTNVHVTYPGWNTTPAGPLTGVPASANYTVTKNGAPVSGVPAYPFDHFVDRATNPSVSVSGAQAGDQFCASLSIAPTAGIVDRNGNILRITSGNQTTPPTCTGVFDAPYVHFSGSDVSAGGGFGANCIPDPSPGAGGIQTFINRPSGGPLTPQMPGSGVQFGALAIKPIEGFVSANLRSSPPTSPTGLSFANTNVPPDNGSNNPVLGGDLGGTNCITDYFAQLPSNIGPPSSAPNATLPGTNTSGSTVNNVQYYKPASVLTLDTSQTVDDFNHIVMFVKGNVYIQHDLKYTHDTWPSPEAVPSVYLIVEGGNIYIDPSVTELDGLYVSEPDPDTGSTTPNPHNPGGHIYDCAIGVTEIPLNQSLSQCHKQLLVNGSFVALHTHLSRSYGSLRDSSGGEHFTPGAPAKPCDGDLLNKGDCAAELFNFSPELLLSQSPLSNTITTTGQYESVITLSPVL